MVVLPASSRELFRQRRLRSTESLMKSNWLPRKYPCPDCGRAFNIRASLVRHRIYECEGSGHQASQPLLKLTKLQQQPQDPQPSRSGRRSASGQGTTDKPIVRKKATLVQQSKSSRQVVVKPRGKRLHTCPNCNKSYKFFTSLWRHRNYECGVEPQFVCTLCPAKFSQKSNLDRHARSKHSLT